MRHIVIACSFAIAASLLAIPALAQQKTVKACQEEWRANKAANQAKGITERAYVDQCRAGSTAAQPGPASTSVPPAATKSPPKETKTVAPPPAPVTPAPAPNTTAGSKAKETKTVAPAASASAPAGANQFSTEAQAKARCLTGTVVWANLESKIYHFAGNKTYGNTKSGAYMCESDATAQGMRAAKNEKHL